MLSPIKRTVAVPLHAAFRVRKHAKHKWGRFLLRFEPSYRNLKRLRIIDHFNGYPAEAFEPEYADLWGLYLIVMERKPAVVLELGGGYSTFVFAHAAWSLAEQGHTTKVYSVDESDYWQQVVMSHMPKDLLPFVQFHRSDPCVTEVEGELASVFQSLPVDSCNFVYVDGGLPPGCQTRGANRGADALLLERNAPSDYTIQIDGRRKTAVFLQRHLKYNYDIGPGRNGVQTLFVRRA